MYKVRLSPYAKIFYTEWLLDPNSSRYNLAIDQTLYGDLDFKRLKAALKRYIADHVVLNSHIQEIDGEPYWVKNNSIVELECSNYQVGFNELLDYISCKFELYRGPLYRFKLIKIKNGVSRFIIVFHHILVGGASTDVGVSKAIPAYYNDEKHIAEHSIDRQIELLTNLTEILTAKLDRNKMEHKKFWYKELSGIDPINLKFLQLNRNNYKTISSQKNNSTGELRFNYGKAESEKLGQIKRHYIITPYIYSLCVFALLLNRYTNQERLAISYPIAIKEGLDFIYGAQVNTNLIPYQFSQTTTIVDLFDQSRAFFSALKHDEVNHSYYPIANILYNQNSHLLNISFIQAYFKETSLAFQGMLKIETQNEFNVDPINYFIFEQDLQNHLNYRVRYNKENISEELLKEFVVRYKRLFLEILEDLINGNDKKLISSYDLLDQEQYRQLIYKTNQAKKGYPQNKPIHQLFEEQALKTPGNIAMVYEDTKLTYLELNKKANQLARYLLDKHEIYPDDLIVLYLDRSELMLIAILATLKTGAAYVPIDPTYPDSRTNYILTDTRAKIILTNEIYIEKLRLIGKSIETLNIIAIDGKKLQSKLVKQQTINPITIVTSDNLIYVIYTSGTTGNPKGVMQQHNNVMRLFTATDDWYHFTDKDIWTLFHSYAFDFSVWEIWGALIYGGKLIIPTVEQCMDTHMFYELCARKRVTILNQTPQAFYQFMDVATKKFNKNKLSDLRYIIFGGEALIYASLPSWFGLYGYGKPRLINMYGITETTVHVTYKEITEKDIEQSSNIGIPIPDQKIFILDVNLTPLPTGAIGELYVGGEGLARGYLNQPELTAIKFISNPFQTDEEKTQNKNGRLYKTGDLVRRLIDNSLEYVGRNDFQVKIRGYRVELGEIENALLSYPEIRQAAVLIKENTNDLSQHISDKYIVAYYVADKKLDVVGIYNHLTNQLPEYMLPSMLIYLNELPLTINGKLDRAALPEPKFETDDRYIAPRSEQEKLICKAFTKVLGVEKIGINDDFFKLGGNSLKAISLTSDLQTNFDVKVAHIFNLHTPLKLAENLHASKDIIIQKLELIKSAYKNFNMKRLVDGQLLQDKISHYLENINNLQIDYSLRKPITNVLLTGATGYLGCNILNQMLKLTNYKIFLLIRASSQTDAINRINKKFHFYFDKTLDEVYNSRVFVFKSDIEKSDLGLSPQEYHELTDKVDSVIHAAGLVKHYGEYDEFYSANVRATINLLEFSKLTTLKDFHYVSTYSVLKSGFIPGCDKYIYTEDDIPDSPHQHNNFYVQTKLQGEQQTIRSRSYGISSNIYRIGNLAFIAENGRTQENIEDNAFFNCIRCLLKMKNVAKELDLVEISPVDYTARAIVKLFDKKQLENRIYHVFNPYSFYMSAMFLDDEAPAISSITMEQFINNIIGNLNDNAYHDLIVRFLLHQGWLDGWDAKNTTIIEILQDKTKNILKYLGFEWAPITSRIFNNYLELL